MSDEEKVYFRAGVLGDASKMAELNFKKWTKHCKAYFGGVALGGHAELVNRL